MVLLVFIGMPLQYMAGDPTVVGIVGPLHGFLYIVYLLAAADLFRRIDWPFVQLIWVILAGLFPSSRSSWNAALPIGSRRNWNEGLERADQYRQR